MLRPAALTSRQQCRASGGIAGKGRLDAVAPDALSGCFVY